MLGKLMKYEWKATMRSFLPIYGAILIVALIGRIMLAVQYDNIAAVLGMVLVPLLIALAVISILICVQRFKNTLFDREGYLTFTLPVRTESIIAAKLIVSLLWLILSMIVACLAGFIILISPQLVEQPVLEELQALGEMLLRAMPVLSSMLLLIICYYLAFVCTVYAALSIAQLPKLIRHYTAVALIVFLLLTIVFDRLFDWCWTLFGYTGTVAISQISAANAATPVFLIASAMGLVQAAIMFLVTNYIIKNRLNLE